MKAKIKYRGVWYDPKRKKYRATCEYKSKSIFIGRFATAKQAAIAYDTVAKKLWGLRAKLNFGDWCRATHFQLRCYKLCSPDFAGLTQRQAAKVLNIKNSNISLALKRLRKKCPELFPIYNRIPQFQRFEDWMKVSNPHN